MYRYFAAVGEDNVNKLKHVKLSFGPCSVAVVFTSTERTNY